MIIFHVDVNNAFLSWESTHRLREATSSEIIDLRTIPSAIGGDQEQRHGIILAKSTPAKAFGIKTAETISDALKKCPDLVIVPPRMDIYRQYSHQLMELLSEYTDTVEQYSIDEAFLDMTGTELLFGEPVAAAEGLKNRIHRELGFTVNIGVSTNKLLAKMASDFEKPNKVHTLFPEEIESKMWPLPVSELFFVGKASKQKLFNLGIRTIGDLAHTDSSILRSHLGKYGETIHGYANGVDSSIVCKYAQSPKGYSNEMTLSTDLTDEPSVRKQLLQLCESVGKRLRADCVKATVVSVLYKDFTFRSTSHQCTLDAPTDITNELYKIACQLFSEYWDGTPIRLIGFAASKVTNETSRQLNLIDRDRYLRQEKLDSALDDIRKKFGDDSITRASFLSEDNK